MLDGRGEEALGKPRGSYVTLTLEGLAGREEGIFQTSPATARTARWKMPSSRPARPSRVRVT